MYYGILFTKAVAQSQAGKRRLAAYDAGQPNDMLMVADASVAACKKRFVRLHDPVKKPDFAERVQEEEEQLKRALDARSNPLVWVAWPEEREGQREGQRAMHREHTQATAP